MRILTILVLVALVGCSDRSAQSVDPRIADASRPLVFITNPTEPPTSYTNASGEVVGTDIDLARRIAAKMNRKLVVEKVMFPDILPRLKAGTADFGIATITINEARQRDVNFSAPYAFGGSCFLYRSGDPKPRMSQVDTLNVGVKTDTVQDFYISSHGGDPIRYKGLVEAVAALESGEIDAIFLDDIPLRKLAEKSSGRFSITPFETRDGYGVAVDKRRPDVLVAANAVIAEGGAK